MTPTLYLTNWSSKTTRGPGTPYMIMAQPRAWEHGDGKVWALVPSADAMRLAKSGRMSMGEYRAGFIASVPVDRVAPGQLGATVPFSGTRPVKDGDTLCCACSKDAAERGECHRVWSADILRRAGWRVVLDGRELAGVDEQWMPVLTSPLP